MKADTPQITFQFNQGLSGDDRKRPLDVAIRLDLLRSIEESEIPSADQARELADHLAENETARSSWPGEILFSFFRHSGERGALRSFELNALACVVRGILIHLDGATIEAAAGDVDRESLTSVEPLRLPDSSLLDRLGLNQVAGFPEIFFGSMQCDCMDWQSVRRKLPATSPGRLCKHLSRLIHLNSDRLPPMSPPLRRLIDWAGRSIQALPAHPEWRLLIAEPEPMIAAWGGGKSCSVFANSTAGEFTQYVYHIGDRQWVGNQRPDASNDPTLRSLLAEVMATAP